MEYVITCDGLLKKDDYVIPPFEILSKIPEWVSFEENLTFRQLLTFFNNYPDLYYVFPELKNVSDHVYDTFDGDLSEDAHLAVYQTCTLSWSSKSVKEMTFVKDDPNSQFSRAEFTYEDKEQMFDNMYYGVSLIKPFDEEKSYSITFMPISEMLDLPFKLGDNQYSVCIEKDYKNVSEPMVGCSLFNLMDAVIDSVDFFGDEDRKKDELQKLKDIMADIDEEIDNNKDDE